jgi:5'-3' exonuclease
MSDTSAVLEAPAAEAAQTTEIALVDLSSIAYPIWHMSGSQPDPDYTSQQIVSRVRALTAKHPKAAICCDSGKSFRNELSPDYKAQREAAPAALFHQIALAKERLEADGFPVWAVRGFEADDLIASAARQALAFSDTSVLVFSGDKDLLQLVGPRVRVQSTNNGTVYDSEGVRAKFGVGPAQIGDYLALVGDSADNVKGAEGIGPKKAADLLSRFGNLAGVYDALTNQGTQFKPAMATALREFEARRDQTVKLITLRTDVDLPFAELDNDRVAKDAAPMEGEAMLAEVKHAEVVSEPIAPAVVAAPASVPVTPAAGAVPGNGNGNHAPAVTAAPAAMPVVTGEVLAAAPVEFEKQLEPRSIGQAMQLANAMYKARLFNAYGTPEAVLSTVLMGRELGLQATASLRAFHLIEGKHALAADAMRGLVLRSGVAKYFRCVERTASRATFETLRAGEPEPTPLSYTIDEARIAYGFGFGLNDRALAELEGKWQRSSWGKHPADMLAARASSKLARLVYSDILFGLYAPEELRD